MRVQSLLDEIGLLIFEIDQKSYGICLRFYPMCSKEYLTSSEYLKGNGEKGKCCFLGRIFEVQFIHLYLFIYYTHASLFVYIFIRMSRKGRLVLYDSKMVQHYNRSDGSFVGDSLVNKV